MSLLQTYLRTELQEMLDKGIRLTTIGNIEALRGPIKETLLETMEMTAHNKGMVLNLALSYGGRDEIIMAVKGLIRDIGNGKIKDEDVTKELFSSYLLYSRSAGP